MARFLSPDPHRIDPDWMTQALRAAGVLKDARVIDLARTPIGNGLIGDSFRFSLTYDGDEPGAPATVVGKFPAIDPASRKSGSDHFLYKREVTFYRQWAPSADIQLPEVLVAEIDPVTDDFTLIFTDLAPARAVDQLTDGSLKDAQTALREAAALHAPRWGDASLEAIDWLAAPAVALSPMVDAVLPPVIGMFKDRYKDVLEPEFVALIEQLPPALIRSREDRSAPWTILHGDFRLDNMLFDVNGGARPMATLDWQTVMLGAGVVDVAYFLSAGINPIERREHEQTLVREYHAELMGRGVRDYDWPQCWFDYRRATLHGILMGVFSSMAVERTERGDIQFLKMTRGACQQALELDTFALWAD